MGAVFLQQLTQPFSDTRRILHQQNCEVADLRLGHQFTRPLRTAYEVMSALDLKHIFSSTRVR
jgi:hypothetical protein